MDSRGQAVDEADRQLPNVNKYRKVEEATTDKERVKKGKCGRSGKKRVVCVKVCVGRRVTGDEKIIAGELATGDGEMELVYPPLVKHVRFT